MSGNSVRIFLSHSSLDTELTRALVDLLRQGLDIHREDLLCTSIPEYGVPAGEDHLGYLRRELANLAVAVSLVTPSYLESRFCQHELGVIWALAADHIALLVPPIVRSDANGLLSSIQAPYILDGLDELAHRLSSALGRPLFPSKWNESVIRFSERLAEVQSRPLVRRNDEQIELVQSLAAVTLEARNRARFGAPSNTSDPDSEIVSLYQLLYRLPDLFDILQQAMGHAQPESIDTSLHFEVRLLGALEEVCGDLAPGSLRLTIWSMWPNQGEVEARQSRIGWRGDRPSLEVRSRESALREVLLAGDAIFEPDCTPDSPAAPDVQRFGSYLLMPVIVDGDPLALLEILARRPSRLRPVAIAVGEVMASLLGLAMKMTRVAETGRDE